MSLMQADDFSSAQEAVKSGEIDKAIVLYKKILNQDKENSGVLSNLSLLYMQQGDLLAAEKILNDALALNPNDSTFHNNLGLIALKKQDYPRAESCFKAALQKKSDYFAAMYNLAFAFKGQAQYQDAVASLLAILQVEPKYIKAYFLLGKIQLENKNPKEANHYFYKAASLFPDDVIILENIVQALLEFEQFKLAKPYCLAILDQNTCRQVVWYNLGVIAEKENEAEKSEEYYKKSLELDPDYFPALNNLGVLCLAKQETSEARQYFERAQKLMPENESIRYTLSALKGEKIHDRAPGQYIANLFDAYADHFDVHLKEGLSYQVPQQLFNLLEEYLPRESLTMLDLGCGTGLAAEKFSGIAKEMVGVDLSRKMCDQAKKKEIFSEVYCMDMLDFLKITSLKFDLILAGDVFVYTGDLMPIFSAAKNVLASAGLFAFSIEVSQRQNFLLQPSGRFSHSEKYIEDLAVEYGFKVLQQKNVTTRLQFNEPVLGRLYLLSNFS